MAERGVQLPAQGLVGRRPELDRLHAVLGAKGPTATFVHGVAGIGKSTLLAAFAAEARSSGAVVVGLDCRALEPTDRGTVDALASALGLGAANLTQVVRRLERLPGPIVIQLDHFEVFRLLDTWLRQTLMPALPERSHLILAGREPPVAAWLTDPDTGPRVGILPLGALAPEDAVRLLTDLGVHAPAAERLNATLRGHPLAIRLAAAAAAARPNLGIDDLAAHAVVDKLSRIFLADVPDPIARQALEAVSTIRRTTVSLLAALLPDAPPQDVLERLRDLPFFETRQDGLGLHEAVQSALATSLNSTDPSRYRRYRIAAWRQLREEVATAPSRELWRYTADMLYLIENPVVREAFFPSGAQPLAVEPTTPADLPAIEEIARRHDGDIGAQTLLAWYREVPHAFSAIRDRDAVTVAFSCLLDGRTVLTGSVDDPVVARWREHLRAHPPPHGQQVLGFRRWLDLDHGERPGSSQAASWLDVKRTYMELRPSLRRIYVTVEDAAVYLPVVSRLGFRPLGETEAPAELGGRQYTSVVLDFGPGSVDGWLAGLVAAELGLEAGMTVDEPGREVQLNGTRIRLTPFEFGVLRCLEEHEGAAVARTTLLDAVWGYDSDVGSNVVDAVVRRLRQKLGPTHAVLETVRGTGYRLVIR